MSKVFTQITPEYQGSLVALEADVNLKDNFYLLDKYNVMTIPTSVLIDTEGNVRSYSGYISPEDMKKKLDSLIK